VEANLELTKSVFVSSVLSMNPQETELGAGTFQQVDYILDKYHFKTMQKRRTKILKSLDINDGVKNS
jgi:hypothetical protein